MDNSKDWELFLFYQFYDTPFIISVEKSAVNLFFKDKYPYNAFTFIIGFIFMYTKDKELQRTYLEAI